MFAAAGNKMQHRHKFSSACCVIIMCRTPLVATVHQYVKIHVHWQDSTWSHLCLSCSSTLLRLDLTSHSLIMQFLTILIFLFSSNVLKTNLPWNCIKVGKT